MLLRFVASMFGFWIVLASQEGRKAAGRREVNKHSFPPAGQLAHKFLPIGLSFCGCLANRAYSPVRQSLHILLKSWSSHRIAFQFAEKTGVAGFHIRALWIIDDYWWVLNTLKCLCHLVPSGANRSNSHHHHR